MRLPSRSLNVLLVLFATAASVHAGPRDEFDTLVREVQASPQNDTLRERVIAVALALKPPPAVPAEARRHIARAQGAVELARTPKEMAPAIAELDKALLIAPWLAEGYYNRGIIADKAGRYADAVRDLRLYLLAAPGAADAGKVEMLLAKIEYKAEQSSPAAQEARKQQEFSSLLKGLNGAVFRDTERGSNGFDEIRITGDIAVYGTHVVDRAWLEEYWRLNPQMPRSPFMESRRTRLTGFETPYGEFICNIPPFPGEIARPGTLVLSPDGRRINVRRPCPGKPDVVYLRFGS